MSSVTLWRVHVTILAVENSRPLVLHILSVSVALVIQRAKLNDKLYCHLWSVRLYKVFPHCLTKVTIWGKGGGIIVHTVGVVLFSQQLLSETFLTVRRNERVIVITKCKSLCKASVFFFFV